MRGVAPVALLCAFFADIFSTELGMGVVEQSAS